MAPSYYQTALELYNQGHLYQSKSFLIANLARDGRHLPSLHLLSRILYLENDREAALEALSRGLALEPDSLPLLFGRGVMLAALGADAEALAAFEAVLRLDPGHDQAHNNRGNALLALGRPTEALDAYRKAAAANATNADAHYNMGIVLEQFGNFELAERCLRLAIGLAPANAQFRRSLAECAVVRHGDENMLATSAPPEERARLHFGLAKGYDDLGETAAAFRHYAAGNALKRATIGYDEAETLRRLQPPGQARMPGGEQPAGAPGAPVPIFILGMPRSGSTLVEQILSRHPRVTPAGETGLFPRLADEALKQHGGSQQGAKQQGMGMDADAMLALPAEHIRRLATAYREALARRHPGSAFITDKTPVNFRYLPLIRAALPGAIVIHTHRDPGDTCLSCFFRLFAGESQPFSYDLSELTRYYGAYRRLMAHWRQILPPTAMLDIAYERVVTDLPGQARRLLDFCGLAWSEESLTPHRGLRFVASDSQVLRPLYTSSIGRWRRYAAYLDTPGLLSSPSPFSQAKAAR